MNDAVRIAALADSRRRAGFRFGRTATVLVGDQVSPAALLALVDDPFLVVEITNDGESWEVISGERAEDLREAVETLGAAALLSIDQVRADFVAGRITPTTEALDAFTVEGDRPFGRGLEVEVSQSEVDAPPPPPPPPPAVEPRKPKAKPKADAAA